MPVVTYSTSTSSGASGSPPPQALTLAQLRTEARLYLMNTIDDTESFSWSDDELNQYLNEAVLYTQSLTKIFEDIAILTVVAGQVVYNLPSDADQLKRVTFDGVFLPQTNEYELDRDNPNWRVATAGNPVRFYLNQFNQLSLFPTPSTTGVFYTFSAEKGEACEFTLIDGVTVDSAVTFNQNFGFVIGYTDTAGGIVRIVSTSPQEPFINNPDVGLVIEFDTDESNLSFTFAKTPDEMGQDTDVPQLPAFLHPALTYFAVMKAFARDGEFQDLDLAQAWFAVYSDWLESAMELIARTWPTRVKTFEPYEPGSLFGAALATAGSPIFGTFLQG